MLLSGANVPVLSVLLMLGLLREAVSIAFGFGLSLLSYGLLYRDLGRAMRLLKRAGGPIAQGSLSWATGRPVYTACDGAAPAVFVCACEHPLPAFRILSGTGRCFRHSLENRLAFR